MRRIGQWARHSLFCDTLTFLPAHGRPVAVPVCKHTCSEGFSLRRPMHCTSAAEEPHGLHAVLRLGLHTETGGHRSRTSKISHPFASQIIGSSICPEILHQAPARRKESRAVLRVCSNPIAPAVSSRAQVATAGSLAMTVGHAG